MVQGCNAHRVLQTRNLIPTYHADGCHSLSLQHNPCTIYDLPFASRVAVVSNSSQSSPASYLLASTYKLVNKTYNHHRIGSLLATALQWTYDASNTSVNHNLYDFTCAKATLYSCYQLNMPMMRSR